MKKLTSTLVAGLLLTTTLYAKDHYATVNGDKITKADIALALQDPRIDFAKLPDNAKKQVLNRIIDTKLVAQNALKTGITKDKEFKENLEKIKENLALQVWQKKELKKVKISTKEQKDFYTKNKDKFKQPQTSEARHILVKTKKEAQSLISQLNKAKNKETKFIELAKSKSTGPSGPRGGYLGKFPKGQMVPEFEAALSKLKKKTYTKAPVKTQFGYHVIYLVDRQTAKSSSFNEVKGNISQLLIQNKFNKQTKKLVDSLRKKAKIVIK